MNNLKRILIADDSQSERAYYKMLFKRLKLANLVVIFEDGKYLINELIDSNQPSQIIVITDYCMPTSGLEVVKCAVQLGVSDILVRSSSSRARVLNEISEQVEQGVDFASKIDGKDPIENFLIKSGLNLH